MAAVLSGKDREVLVWRISDVLSLNQKQCNIRTRRAFFLSFPVSFKINAELFAVHFDKFLEI